MNSVTDTLILAKVTSKKIETRLRYMLPCLHEWHELPLKRFLGQFVNKIRISSHQKNSLI